MTWRDLWSADPIAVEFGHRLLGARYNILVVA